jgi:hypothetical protein
MASDAPSRHCRQPPQARYPSCIHLKYIANGSAELLNDAAVAAYTGQSHQGLLSRQGSLSRQGLDSRQGSQPAPLSRIPSMYSMDNDNVSMSGPSVSRLRTRYSNDDPFGPSVSQPASRPLSRVPSVTSRMNDNPANPSHPLSRTTAMSPTTSASNQWDGFGDVPHPMSRITHLALSTSGPTRRIPTPYPTLRSLRDISTSTSHPQSRIPSPPSHTNEGGIGNASAPLSRISSTMSLLGNEYNDHKSKFFPAAVEPLPKSPSYDHHPIGTGRPRKDSMAKASIALNEAVNATSRSKSAADADTGDEKKDDDGEEKEKEKCAIHGNGCGGVAVLERHRTEDARLTSGILGEVPMMECLGREMVDWARVVEEERGGLQ